MIRARFGRFALATAMVGIAAVSAAPIPASGAGIGTTDWAQPGRTSGRTAYNGYAGINSTSFLTMHRLWSKTGGQFSTPVVVNGHVIVSESSSTGPTRLTSYTLTGAQEWRVAFGSGPNFKISPPSADAVRVFAVVGSSGGGWHHTLVVLDAATGSLVWKVRIGATIAHRTPSDIVAAGGDIYVKTDSSGTGPFTTVLAYAASSGALRWTKSVPQGIGSFVVGGGGAYTLLGASGSTSVDVDDADSGVALYSISVDAGSRSLAYSAGELFAAGDTSFEEIDASYPLRRWSVATTPGCSARVAMVSPQWAVANQTCPGSSAPELLVYRPEGTHWGFIGATGSDRFAAGSADVILAVNGGQLHAWSIATRVAITTPALGGVAAPPNLPIMAAYRVFVPEAGRFEVFGP